MALTYEPLIAGSSGLKASNLTGKITKNIMVKVMTFDTLSSAPLTSFDTVAEKINVEGFETDVLKSALSLFNGDLLCIY